MDTWVHQAGLCWCPSFGLSSVLHIYSGTVSHTCCHTADPWLCDNHLPLCLAWALSPNGSLPYSNDLIHKGKRGVGVGNHKEILERLTDNLVLVTIRRPSCECPSLHIYSPEKRNGRRPTAQHRELLPQWLGPKQLPTAASDLHCPIQWSL